MVNNLTEILYRSHRDFGSDIAQLSKIDETWVPRTYQALWQEVGVYAAGLAALGVGAHDRVALLAKTRAEWVIADYAVMLLKAVTVPIYPSLPDDQVAFILEDAGAKWVIVEDDQQREKIPRNYVTIAMCGHPPESTSWVWLRETGLMHPLEDLEGQIASITRDTLATIVYTSGTTGQPKGVMLSHGNILSNIEGFHEEANRYPEIAVGPGDVALSFLPLSHILERMAHAYLLSRGVTLAYAQSVDRLPQNLLEVRPTLLVSVPRVFEKVYTQVVEQIHSSPRVRQRIFWWAVKVGRQHYQRVLAGSAASPSRRFTLWAANQLVYRKVRTALGGRLRFAISGGAPLSREIGEFFYALGITVLEGYGLTETSPVLSVNQPNPPRYGTVGRPLSNVMVKLAPDGEILARGPNVMQGYWNLPEETHDAIEDGWFHTGDIGELSADGFLTVTDRKKYLLVLSTGKNVAPAVVESRLILSPYIDQALVIGDRQKFVGALLYLNPDKVQQWARDHDLRDASYSDLLAHPELYRTIMQEVTQLTSSLAAFEQPKRVRFLPHELTEERGELTPSLKIKVPVVLKHYQDLVEDLYRQEEPSPMSAPPPAISPNPIASPKIPPLMVDILGSVVLGAVFGLLLKVIL